MPLNSWRQQKHITYVNPIYKNKIWATTPLKRTAEEEKKTSKRDYTTIEWLWGWSIGGPYNDYFGEEEYLYTEEEDLEQQDREENGNALEKTDNSITTQNCQNQMLMMREKLIQLAILERCT